MTTKRELKVKIGDQILMTGDDGYRQGDIYIVNKVSDDGRMYTSGGLIYPSECKLLTSVWEADHGET